MSLRKRCKNVDLSMSCLSYRGQFLCFSRDPWSCVCVWLACWWGVYVIACLLPSRLPAILGSSKLQSVSVWLGCVVLNHCFSPPYSFPLFFFVLLSPSPTGVSSKLYPCSPAPIAHPNHSYFLFSYFSLYILKCFVFHSVSRFIKCSKLSLITILTYGSL